MTHLATFCRPELALAYCALALLAWPVAVMAAQAPDPWTGNWRDAQMRIETTTTADGVSGTIVFKDQKFPFTAMINGDRLTGSFRAGEDRFDFTASFDGNTLTFTTGGKTYSLTRDVQPVNPLGRDAAHAAPNPLAADQAVAPSAALAPQVNFRQYTLPDPYLNCTAWTFVAPADWKINGGVSWTGRLNPGPAYSTSLSVRSPDAALEYQLFPIFMFMETNNRMLAGGSEIMGVQDPENCITRIIVPRCRRGIQNVRVISSEKLPKMAEQTIANARAGGLAIDGMQVASGRVLLEYTFDGKAMEEMFYCTVASLHNPRMGLTSWAIDRAFSYRAEKGKLETSMPLLGTIGSSMRENPQWVSARRQALQRIVAAASPPPQISTGSRGPSILDVSKSMARDQDSFLKGLDTSAQMRDHALQIGTYAPRNTQIMTDPVLGEQTEVANGYLHYYRDYYGQVHGSDLNASDFYTQYHMNVTEMQGK